MDGHNWGLRPFRMLKCWADFAGHEDFVRNQWRSYNIDGWGCSNLKEKLKLLKGSLKDWHHQHTQNMEGMLHIVYDRMATLDFKGESHDLLDEEAEELHDLSSHVHFLARVHASMSWQQARLTFSWNYVIQT